MSVVWFDEETSVAKVGGKGRSLCRMWQAGLPVPAGFCITADQLDCLDLGQLDRALTKLETQQVAVRSSAIQEDAAAASYAGIYLTRLNVIGAEGVAAALREIRRSAFAPFAANYSQRQNVTECSEMAAVIQKFVAAEVSGIVFAAETVNVEASWGLGESVVGGLVTPDRWTLSNDGRMISSNIADKDIAIVGDDDGGTKQVKVDPARRRRASLTPDSLQQLCALACKCRELFGGPQDIEWAVESNRVWILQSRPITRAVPKAID